MLVGVEMDARDMSALALYFVAGFLLGLLYFQAVWWSARLFAENGRTFAAVGLTAARIVLLVGVLALASRQGAMPLLLMALGVLGARPLVMRRHRVIVP
ncbi:MAG TPA: ATP synthase subunit I [Acidocella sp.]|nr:ATP synthase subunit I [Acidocella sp.]